MDLTKQKTISYIKKRNIYHKDVPITLQDSKEIIVAERLAGIRISKKRGYDVINDRFFLTEFILTSGTPEDGKWNKEYHTFSNFDEYYEYLDGDIYQNSCYYQCQLPKSKYPIIQKKFYLNDSLIDYTIDDVTPDMDDEEKAIYKEGEKRKKDIKKWIEKFNQCDNFVDFSKTVESYYDTELEEVVDIGFYFWNYIFEDINDINRFNVIMQYISTGNYPEFKILNYLCHIYDPDEVVAFYDYSGSKSKYKRDLRQYAEKVKSGEIRLELKYIFFDTDTHFFCVSQHRAIGVKIYFETLNELLEYLNYDLSGADLSDAVVDDYDFSKCIVDSNTRLPLCIPDNPICVVKKYYKDIRSSFVKSMTPSLPDGGFVVEQQWYDDNNVIIKEVTHKFLYFFDFVAFLKGDLSGADLLQCEGLINLNTIDGLNFTDVELTSAFCDKFGIGYDIYDTSRFKTESFQKTIDHENSTELVLQSYRSMIDASSTGRSKLFVSSNDKERIYYISDIHLVHQILNFNPKTKIDIKFLLNSIVRTLINESEYVLLIDGDTSCDFDIFVEFIKILRNELKKAEKHIVIVFTLGNHDLWSFTGNSYEQIVQKYKEILSQNDMYLIEGDILYQNYDKSWNIIPKNDIETLSSADIREKVRESRLILFGGQGFSGCNKEFNATSGIYRKTISRRQEISESKKFKKIYDKVLSALPDKKVVVTTHMPMDCWNTKVEYHNNYIYISGHTHKNYFYDDGVIRIYADNQIGYNHIPHTKYLEIDNEYDYLCDYADGIYEITADDYIKFHRGKNISLNFNWKVSSLYMLKKNGYYCFIHETPKGSLTILNGGARRTLHGHDIEYYFQNMDSVINNLKRPLDKYNKVQQEIATGIRNIGGSGNIHGCIIDIDFFNHIYVNPIDLKITPYYAMNMGNKWVYDSIPTLLEEKSPKLYQNYLKLITTEKDNQLTFYSQNNIEIKTSYNYLDTDIYKDSRIIKKMQKLNNNILTVWNESNNNRYLDSKS